MLANTQLKGLAGAFHRSDTVSAQCGSQPFAKDNLQKNETVLDSLAAARLAPTHNYFFDQPILIPDMNPCLLQRFCG